MIFFMSISKYFSFFDIKSYLSPITFCLLDLIFVLLNNPKNYDYKNLVFLIKKTFNFSPIQKINPTQNSKCIINNIKQKRLYSIMHLLWASDFVF